MEPKHNCHSPKSDEQVLYMLPLLHLEDIDKDFVSGNQVSVCPSAHIASNMCTSFQVICDNFFWVFNGIRSSKE